MKEGWTYKRLGDVSKIQNGFAFESKLFNSEGRGLPLIRIRDIKRGFSETYTDEECDDAYIVNNGEYLIGMDGDFNVGYWSGGRALLNQRVCKLVPSDKINPRYVYYYLPKALLEINSKTAYSTVKHLSSKQVAEINIPYPPLSEQEKIVSYLDAEFATIDALKANIEQQLQASKDLFQSALKEFLTPKEGWEEKMLGNICDILDSKRKPITKNKREAGNIPYYGATGILDYVKDYIFNERLVLLGEDGAKWGAGENSAYIIEGKSWVNNHAHALRPHRNIILDEFLVYYLNYSDLSESITGVTVPKLNQEKMRAIVVPMPSLPEQERIAARLDAISEKVKALQANYDQTITLCNDLKQSLLKSIFE